MAGWLGLASGLFINFVLMVLVGYDSDVSEFFSAVFLLFPGIGLAVGWTLGLIVKVYSKDKLRPPKASEASTR